MAEFTAPMFSQSEETGIALVPKDARRIYSVGISTGGIAEMRMAERNPTAHIVATTIDQKGAAFAKERIREQGFTDMVDVKIEDVAKEMAYADGEFDYIYARLVLHYLSKSDLAIALGSLHRVVRTGGKLFAVVRSTDCPDARQPDIVYDPETCFTTCTGSKGDTYDRYYHSEASIAEAVADAGFDVESTRTYDEQLFVDFMRSQIAEHKDNVVELVATKR